MTLKDDVRVSEILHLPKTLIKSSSTNMSEPDWRNSLARLMIALLALFAAHPIGGRSQVSSRVSANWFEKAIVDCEV